MDKCEIVNQNKTGVAVVSVLTLKNVGTRGPTTKAATVKGKTRAIRSVCAFMVMLIGCKNVQ